MIKGKPEYIPKYNIYSILAIIFAFIIYPVGLILAIIALVQISKTQEKGKGLAISAIVIPLVILIFISLLVIFLWFRSRFP